MTIIDDNTPNSPGQNYVKLTSFEPDYETRTTTPRTVRLPSRGTSDDHHILVAVASPGAPLTITGYDSANPIFNVPLVGGPVVVTTPGLHSFHNRPAANAAGVEWVPV